MLRIVITSSTGTVQVVTTQPISEPTVYSEQDWNSSSIKEVEEMGSKSGPVVAYHDCASKTLAEKGGFLNILSFGLPLTYFL